MYDFRIICLLAMTGAYVHWLLESKKRLNAEHELIMEIYRLQRQALSRNLGLERLNEFDEMFKKVLDPVFSGESTLPKPPKEFVVDFDKKTVLEKPPTDFANKQMAKNAEKKDVPFQP